jgi:hypothetical protein
MEQQLKLSILYTRKVAISSEENLDFEKESIIRRTQDQYAIVINEGVRYVIFENTDEKEPYIIVGKLMGGNKYKNYFLSSVDLKEFSENEIKKEDMKKFLQSILAKNNGLKEFKKFVKDNFNVDYDNSAS